MRNGAVAMNAQQFGRGAMGMSHVSAANLRSVSLMHGPLPVRPTSQSMHFTNRQTNTTARTNFSQSRFASHSTPPTVQRGPFGQAANGSNFSRYSGTSGSGAAIPGARAFGSTAGTRNIPQTSGGAGWNRFGSSSGSAATARPQGSLSYRGNSGSAGGAPYNSGRSQLQVSPPLVRPRTRFGSAEWGRAAVFGPQLLRTSLFRSCATLRAE